MGAVLRVKRPHPPKIRPHVARATGLAIDRRPVRRTLWYGPFVGLLWGVALSLSMVGVGGRVAHAMPPKPPREAIAANERGIAHLLQDRIGPALDAFRQADAVLPDDPIVRRNLAAAHASRALRLLRARRAPEAAEDLRRARELHPTRIRYRILLARALIEVGRDGDLLSAREALVAALDADPDHLDALVLLAGLDYRDRRLEDGMLRLERARRLRPGDSHVRSRHARMRRELDVERDYESLRGGVFIVRYAPEIPIRRAEVVRAYCEQAWSELCARFGHFPEGQITVTLYPPQDFKDATKLHSWVAGVSDGSIRLTVGERTRNESLRAVLYHELAHHILRDYAPRTPVWLHEGLAQLAEGRDPMRAEARLRHQKGLDERELDRSIISERDRSRVRRYYDLALAFTHYLQRRSGDRGIQELLRSLSERTRIDEAIRKSMGDKRSVLFVAWREALQRR